MYLFQSWFSWGICLVVGLLAHMVVLFLVFKGIPTSSSIVAVSIYIPTINARGFPFPNILSGIYCLQTFWWWPFCVSVPSLFFLMSLDKGLSINFNFSKKILMSQETDYLQALHMKGKASSQVSSSTCSFCLYSYSIYSEWARTLKVWLDERNAVCCVVFLTWHTKGVTYYRFFWGPTDICKQFHPSFFVVGQMQKILLYRFLQE